MNAECRMLMSIRKVINMKKLICLFFTLLFIMSGCGEQTPKTEDWGSFTAEKTWSYDQAFYAIQSTEEKDGISFIVVSVYTAENDKLVYSFMPARASDFWGICWENDSYNIWIQSADVGTQCYQYEDGAWEGDPSAVRPDYIQSKYD